MEYINCFQITSLVLVTMIAIHYFSHKRLNNAGKQEFCMFSGFQRRLRGVGYAECGNRRRRQQ